MKLSGSYMVPAARQRTWDLLLSPDVLCRSIPGCKHLARVGENEYDLKMSLAISSISGLFDGKVRLADQRPPESFRLLVDGSGRIGFVKGDGLLTLAPGDETTEVRYDGDVQAGGLIAGVGQRLLETTAKMIIKRFFERLAAEAKQDASAAPAP